MNTIAVFGNTYQDGCAPLLRQLFEGLNRRVSLTFEPEYHAYLTGLLGSDSVVARCSTFHGAVEADLALSVGGDGTFLHAANHICPAPTPIMGINAGHLGYLSAAPLAEAQQIVDDILRNRYIVEPRAMLAVSGDGLPLPARPYALNEVALLRQDTASMITVDARLDGEQLASYQGDGLIVATPTGSTAYSLSAGGPILAPSAQSWVITPVAPHSLTMRPLVVSADTRIELTMRSRSATGSLSIDGRSLPMRSGSTITIARAPHVINVVRLHRHTFIDALRQKLLWGAAGV